MADLLGVEVGLSRVYPIVDSDGDVYRWPGREHNDATRLAVATAPVVKADRMERAIVIEGLVGFRKVRPYWVPMWKLVVEIADERGVEVIYTAMAVVTADLVLEGDGCANPECDGGAWKAGLCCSCYFYRRRHGVLPAGREYDRLLIRRERLGIGSTGRDSSGRVAPL